MQSGFRLKVMALAALALFFAASGNAQENSAAFLPVWKLMNAQEKQQFIAGYLQGWRDAGRVTEVAIEFVKGNPDQAVRGLEKIKALYDFSDSSALILARAIDTFYSQPENKAATLSQAVSSVKVAMNK